MAGNCGWIRHQFIKRNWQEAHVRKFSKVATIAATAAALGFLMAPVAWSQAAQQTPPQTAPQTPPAAAAPAAGAPKERKVKDIAEYDIFNEVLKDQNSNNPQKAIQDLDTWTQKYPESDWKDQRLYMYMQEYAKQNNAAKVVEYGTQVWNKGIKTVFDDPKEAPRQILNYLFLMTVNIASLPNPTPEQVQMGQQAAKQLKQEAAAFFVPANKPATTSDADWSKARTQLDSAADRTLLVLDVMPANQAAAKGDCAAAEPMYIKALQDHPDSAYVAYQLAKNMICLQKTQPEMASQAIYEFERAAMIDPTLGDPKADPKQLPAYADGLYTRVHGSDEGLAELKQMAKNNPLPPAGFEIKTKEALQAEKDAQFVKNNPKLALWMQIKNALTADNGEQYFASQLKDSAVPQLRGVVVEGKPACRSRELLVSVPTTGAPGPAEIAIKLDAPLSGKPEVGSEILWDGVPTAFSKIPFLLTMEAEKAKVEVKTTPCAAAPPRVTKKKR
jgi:hypothetical protein